MNSITFEAPINSLSFGNVSVNLLREMYAKKMNVCLFPIGGKMDISAFDLSDDFKEWLKYSHENRHKSLTPETPTLKLWHLNGAELRVGKNQVLYTFYEADAPTTSEKNIAELQDHVVFSSQYSQDKFERAGVSNSSFVPLGCDPEFKKTGKEYLADKIHFGLMGKWEKRKHSGEILRAWADKYGNNYKYQLTCLVTNPFFQPQQMNQVIGQALDGKQYGNINFLPFLQTNKEVNDFVNSIDIDLSGLSGAEGWNLPAFNATALGKWSLVLNATSHKDWATDSNAILVEPDGKEPLYDGVFFHPGAEFNQGNMYKLNSELLISKMEQAETLCKEENTEGLKLQENFTYEKTLNGLLSKITV